MVAVLAYFGTSVFAVSGALLAVERSFDLFGVMAVAAVTALGGGTLCDLLLGSPVRWIHDTSTLGLALATGAVTFLLAPEPGRERRWLLIADAIGLAAFAVLGAQTARVARTGIGAELIIGTLSAVAGGMARDLVCGSVPLVLHEDVYATAAVGGAAVYVALAECGIGSLALVCGGLVTLAIRIAAIHLGLTLPRVRRRRSGGVCPSSEQQT
jgi:uncharacterized membrane protein YeiH